MLPYSHFLLIMLAYIESGAGHKTWPMGHYELDVRLEKCLHIWVDPLLLAGTLPALCEQAQAVLLDDKRHVSRGPPS